MAKDSTGCPVAWVDRFFDVLGDQYPVMLAGAREARAMNTALVSRYFEMTLGWMVTAFGEQALQRIADGYAFFTTEVNRAQAAYEQSGSYACRSFDECNKLIYQNREYMTHYYWGVYAILFNWSHYVELMQFYLDRFVARCRPGRVLEIALGHGVWGLLALEGNGSLALEGVDISPAFLDFAPPLARAAGLDSRSRYRCGDATKLVAGDPFDHAICCFMLEHLEQPAAFLQALGRQIRQGGRAFVTLALTAAQPDHIYEFKRESEAMVMAEGAGFRVVESCCTWPKRQLPGARYVPRVQGLIMERL